MNETIHKKLLVLQCILNDYFTKKKKYLINIKKYNNTIVDYELEKHIIHRQYRRISILSNLIMWVLIIHLYNYYSHYMIKYINMYYISMKLTNIINIIILLTNNKL